MVTAGEIFKITESISPSDIATRLGGPLPKTAEATFNFTQLKQQLFSTVVEKKRIASFFASKLSEMIFEKTSGVTEARIPPETFRGFHTKKPEDTEITFFDNVNIPNMDKLSLYGPDLVGATLFGEYTKLGDPWYIVARVSMHACVVGVTGDALITVFNLADKNKYLGYVTKEIQPLIS